MWLVFALHLAFVLGTSVPAAADDSGVGIKFGTADFPCPAELHPRTEFWLKIFSQYGRDSKVLHDNRYPCLIYEIIDVAGLESKLAKEKVASRVEYYAELLEDMAVTDPATFDPEKKRLRDLLAPIQEAARYTRAKERLRTQSGIRESFQAGLARSGRYLPYIFEVLEARGVPLEVAFLPHVESAFDPQAYSKVGAAGLWQFTRGTGRSYMRIETDLDERRDPYASTPAAAKYLRNSFDQLESWPLAVVSYNYGLAGVRRASQTLGSKDIVRVLNEYDGPRFGFASQNFYCEFLAAIEIGQHPELYFPQVARDAAESPLEFKLPDYVKYAELCKGFGLTTTEMAFWNPALGSSYRKGRRAVPQGFVLRLPESFQDAGALYTNIPASERRSKPLRPPGYRVRVGDTLAKIARRHRVTVAELLTLNNIRNQDRIYAGQVLALP